MKKRKLYAEIASLLIAVRNCEKSNNLHWRGRHGEAIDALVGFLPRGGGIDIGPKFNNDESKPDRLVFDFEYHHMNDGGYYNGWTEHKLIVTPSLAFGCDLRITGRNVRDIKDYLHDTFNHALHSDVWFEDGEWHSSIYETESA